jgi:hypothetical protein
MSEDIKRRMTLTFNQKGQPALEKSVAAVDRTIVKAGDTGTKAMQGIAKGTKESAEGMTRLVGVLGDSLGPLKGVAEGAEKMLGVIGSGNPWIAAATLALGGLGLAVKALSGLSDDTAEATARLSRAFDEAQESGARFRDVAVSLAQSGIFDPAKVRELALAQERATDQQDRYAEALSRARESELRAVALLERRAEMVSRLTVAERERDALRRGGAQEAAAQQVAEVARLADELDSLEASLGAANVAQAFYSAQARLVAPDAEAAAKALGETSGAIKGTGDEAEKAAPKVRALSDDLRDFTDRASAMARAAEQMRAARVREVQAEWAEVYRTLVSQAEVRERFREAEAEGARRAAELQRQVDSGDWLSEQVAGYERATSAAQVYGEQLAANAAASVVLTALEGQSMQEALASFLKAERDKAIVEALSAGARALGAAGVALLTGSPAAAAAATQFGLQAAAWGAVAAATGLGAAAVGGGGGGGGGAGAGSQGLTGTSSAQSGPVSVYVNFAGPTTGLGRYLASELNAEAQRQGGARLDSRVVRR